LFSPPRSHFTGVCFRPPLTYNLAVLLSEHRAWARYSPSFIVLKRTVFYCETVFRLWFLFFFSYSSSRQPFTTFFFPSSRLPSAPCFGFFLIFLHCVFWSYLELSAAVPFPFLLDVRPLSTSFPLFFRRFFICLAGSLCTLFSRTWDPFFLFPLASLLWRSPYGRCHSAVGFGLLNAAGAGSSRVTGLLYPCPIDPPLRSERFLSPLLGF